jgi:hypothetical protein
MIEGTVETLDEGGVFRGWLRDTRDPVPALVQIRLDGHVVAEALASAYRADLLRGGHGHGHYGFLARARVALPPGPARFALFLPRHGQGIPVRLDVPAMAPPVRLPVEALLQPETAWTGADLAGAVRCLDLPAQRAAMGTRRFVDVGFRFVLQRWPLPEEQAVYVQAIDDDTLSPDAFLVELLASRERRDLPPGLPSPWDAAFPFTPASVKERA